MDTVLTTAEEAAAKTPDAAASPDIYVIAAHPTWRESRVNRPLMQAAQALPRVQVQDLYSSYPDYAIDVAREQAALARARLVVLLHPIQWYSMPALQKLWLDDVLSYGWAYGQDGRALQGKDLWLVATTGGPEASYHPQSYNRYFFEAFLPPYEQSAILCGMRFLPPMVLHGAHRVSKEAVAEHLAVFSQRLQSYPDWPELEDLEQHPACVVPRKDRLVMGEDSIEAALTEDGDARAATRVGAPS
ncbi:MAG: NAD(P)H-dependent oxidoreductase [Polaromonas sp.]